GSRRRRAASRPPSTPRTRRRASPPSSANGRRIGAASSELARRADFGSMTPEIGPSADVEALAGLLRRARSAVARTGAGISVPSGIPDFRSPGTGLWEKVDPMEVAHISVFEGDPARFWRYYRPRFQTLGDVRPNAAHEALAELERRGLLSGVIT